MSYHEISAIEMRVVGCLIEKEITTPDQYPLSLNSLVNACNQKSNREPVTSFSELEVQDAVDALLARGLVTDVSASHGRVNKYQHRFCNTEFSDLQLSPAETAVVCLLFLRGAQTPGELRSRSGRLHSFASREEVEATLASLQAKTGGPYVRQLPREAGKREQRYQECFCSESDQSNHALSEVGSSTGSDDQYTEQLKLRSIEFENRSIELANRVLELEDHVRVLNERIKQLENASGL